MKTATKPITSAKNPISDIATCMISLLRMTWYVYKLVNTITGDFYIGQTIDLNRRFSQHKKNPGNRFLRYSFLKYGKKAFKIEIMSKWSNKEKAVLIETLLIKKLNPSYNMKPLKKWGKNSYISNI